MVHVLHEVESDKLESTLLYGLKLGKGGDKRSKTITRTDVFLNAHRPKKFREAGVDRETNIYCYMVDDDNVIDITDGEKKKPQDIVKPHHTLLKIEIDPARCYISDLDLYDEVLNTLTQSGESAAQLLAETYWKKVQLFSDYKGGVRRPEVMVPYDIAPNALSRPLGAGFAI